MRDCRQEKGKGLQKSERWKMRAKSQAEHLIPKLNSGICSTIFLDQWFFICLIFKKSLLLRDFPWWVRKAVHRTLSPYGLQHTEAITSLTGYRLMKNRVLIKTCTHLYSLVPDSDASIKIVINNKYLAKNEKDEKENEDYVIFPRLTMFLLADQFTDEALPCTYFPDNFSEEDAATHPSPVQLAFQAVQPSEVGLIQQSKAEEQIDWLKIYLKK